MQQLPWLLHVLAPWHAADECGSKFALGGLDIADPGCCIMQHQSRATLGQQEFILLQAQLSSGFRRTLEGERESYPPRSPEQEVNGCERQQNSQPGCVCFAS